MYLEVTEGNLRGEWKLDDPMSFWRFRENLAEGMLKYKPSARKYPGDQKMRPSKQHSKRQRGKAKTRRGPGRPQKNEQRTGVVREDAVTSGDLKKAICKFCGDKPCTFFLKKGGSLEGSDSLTITMRFSLSWHWTMQSSSTSGRAIGLHQK